MKKAGCKKVNLGLESIVPRVLKLMNKIHDPKDVYKVNVSATKNIAELCEQLDAKLIYLSTDLVYAGYRGSMLNESAKLIPVSLYAETKLMGEMKVKEVCKNYLILRTALLYGFGLNHSRCHFHKMNDQLKKGNPVKLFVDQFRTPISLQNTAEIITKFALMDIKKETINLGGIERVSRYELGEILCSVMGYDNSLLEKISLIHVPELPKVEDVSLNTDKLQSLGFKQISIEESIKSVWQNHPGYHFVQAETDFTAKRKKVVALISQYLDHL